MRDFDRSYIRDEFDGIGHTLDTPISIYLIGGGAMAFRELKDATKDVDVVVLNDAAFDKLHSTLQELDYDVVQHPEDEYADLGAQAILENSGGCRFDVFNQQVVDKLVFSEDMQARSEQLDTAGNLTVRIAASEDVFLFKSVAGRTTDIEDMNTLIQTGLDFDTILRELETQTQLLDEEFFVTFVNEALLNLEERYGVTVPIRESVAEISARVYDQLEILRLLDEWESVEQLRDQLDLEDDRFEEMVLELEAKSLIERDGDTVRKLGNQP